MIAEAIVLGRDRTEGVDRMRETLRTTSMQGIETNLGFLQRVVSHPDFRAGELRTDFVDRNRKALLG